MHANTEFSNDPEEDCTSTSSVFKTVADADDHSNNERQNPNDTEDESVVDNDEDDEDEEEFQPRIVQITNFQQLSAEDAISKAKVAVGGSPLRIGKLIKQEIKSDGEQADGEIKAKKTDENSGDDSSDNSDADDDNHTNVMQRMPICKPSLFTKTPQRQWPWLINNQYNEDNDDDEAEVTDEENNTSNRYASTLISNAVKFIAVFYLA